MARRTESAASPSGHGDSRRRGRARPRGHVRVRERGVCAARFRVQGFRAQPAVRLRGRNLRLGSRGAHIAGFHVRGTFHPPVRQRRAAQEHLDPSTRSRCPDDARTDPAPLRGKRRLLGGQAVVPGFRGRDHDRQSWQRPHPKLENQPRIARRPLVLCPECGRSHGREGACTPGELERSADFPWRPADFLLRDGRTKNEPHELHLQRRGLFLSGSNVPRWTSGRYGPRSSARSGGTNGPLGTARGCHTSWMSISGASCDRVVRVFAITTRRGAMRGPEYRRAHPRWMYP